MITIKLKFLLAFAPNTGKDKKKKQKNVPKKKNEKPVEEDPPYLLRLENQIGSAHIEYELVQGKCKYYLDVICWENAAKIYSPENTKIFKIISKDGIVWVPICVEHHFRELSTEDLINLQKSVIEFNVFIDKNKLGQLAKSNKTEVVYISENEVKNSGFVEAFTEKVNISKEHLQTDDLTGSISTNVTFNKNEVVSLLKYEENFAEKLYDIIKYESNRPSASPDDQIHYKDFVKPNIFEKENKPKDTTKPANTKKAAAMEAKDKRGTNKNKNQKNTPVTKLCLQAQGEIFLTDPALAIFKVENYKAEVSKFIVLFSIDNMLTRSQKIFLNPLVVKVRNIYHFPEEIFENSGFTDIYCKYTIPYIAKCKTIEKPISRMIYFNESHIYFTNHLSKIKLLEFLEAQRLLVEIYGVKRYQSYETNPKLFGEKKTDQNFSKMSKNFVKSCVKNQDAQNGKDFLLAYCSYDLSTLLKNIWDFKERRQLHNPWNVVFKKVDFFNEEQKQFCDYVPLNGINLYNPEDCFRKHSNDNTSYDLSLLKECILISNGTSLSIEAYLLAPQAPALVLHQISGTYKRLFCVFFEKTTAMAVFKKILAYNQAIACKNLKNEDYLTGFVIDNGNNFAIFVEGPFIGYILSIWQDIDVLSVNVAKIFFNSDQAFENRLYDICNAGFGFYIVILKIPLNDILKERKIYVSGNIPFLCCKALMKLSLLLYSNTLKSIMQYNLFPTFEELVSLDLEYGVPMAWKGGDFNSTASISTLAM